MVAKRKQRAALGLQGFRYFRAKRVRCGPFRASLNASSNPSISVGIGHWSLVVGPRGVEMRGTPLRGVTVRHRLTSWAKVARIAAQLWVDDIREEKAEKARSKNNGAQVSNMQKSRHGTIR